MEILNDEQILELCLMAIQHKPEMIDSFPGEFLTYYVIKTMGGDEMSDYEVAVAMNELIANNVLASFVESGHLTVGFDEDGNTSYDRTELRFKD